MAEYCFLYIQPFSFFNTQEENILICFSFRRSGKRINKQKNSAKTKRKRRRNQTSKRRIELSKHKYKVLFDVLDY